VKTEHLYQRICSRHKKANLYPL